MRIQFTLPVLVALIALGSHQAYASVDLDEVFFCESKNVKTSGERVFESFSLQKLPAVTDGEDQGFLVVENWSTVRRYEPSVWYRTPAIGTQRYDYQEVDVTLKSISNQDLLDADFSVLPSTKRYHFVASITEQGVFNDPQDTRWKCSFQKRPSEGGIKRLPYGTRIKFNKAVDISDDLSMDMYPLVCRMHFENLSDRSLPIAAGTEAPILFMSGQRQPVHATSGKLGLGIKLRGEDVRITCRDNSFRELYLQEGQLLYLFATEGLQLLAP